MVLITLYIKLAACVEPTVWALTFTLAPLHLIHPSRDLPLDFRITNVLEPCRVCALLEAVDDIRDASASMQGGYELWAV